MIGSSSMITTFRQLIYDDPFLRNSPYAAQTNGRNAASAIIYEINPILLSSDESISVQWDHRRQGVPKRMLTAFSGSTGDSQPSPCGLVILRLGRLDGPLEFSACGRASGKADDAAFLAGKQGG